VRMKNTACGEGGRNARTWHPDRQAPASGPVHEVRSHAKQSKAAYFKTPRALQVCACTSLSWFGGGGGGGGGARGPRLRRARRRLQFRYRVLSTVAHIGAHTPRVRQHSSRGKARRRVAAAARRHTPLKAPRRCRPEPTRCCRGTPAPRGPQMWRERNCMCEQHECHSKLAQRWPRQRRARRCMPPGCAPEIICLLPHAQFGVRGHPPHSHASSSRLQRMHAHLARHEKTNVAVGVLSRNARTTPLLAALVTRRLKRCGGGWHWVQSLATTARGRSRELPCHMLFL
jgi:hypothetical protein